ncbi:MAG: Ribosomal protein [Acidobacteriota bacterium]|jgi:large subunit ribosomal protein L29|nr:Ribosomal protein [Acidobacteriota bacterium]MDT5063316.1 Ribosomal protein [Acidobacteriota bacterium]
MVKRREEIERLHDTSDEDLQTEAARLKESLFRLNFKLALGEVDAVKNIRQEKRSLARIQTIMRERAMKSA